MLFKRSPRGRKPKDQAGGVFKTAIDRRCDGVTINAFWRHSRVKQYLKDGRALRIETVVNSPDDLGCQRRICTTSPSCRPGRVRSTPACCTLKESARDVSSIVQPLRGYRSPPSPGTAGGPQDYGSATLECMALAGALANMLCAVTGITNKSLRALMTGLLGTPYSMNQASLRSGPPVPQRPDHPDPAPQPVRPHPRRPAVRDLLHQGPRPAPAPAHGRRPAPGSARRSAHALRVIDQRGLPAHRRCTAASSRLTSRAPPFMPTYPA